jgi:dTDP-glucose 4,6-dehydratase
VRFTILGGVKNFPILKSQIEFCSEMGADDSLIEFVPDRLGHDLRYSVDWKKIKDELGYSPQIDFATGLKETIAWYQENEDWWKPLKKA